MQIDPVMAWKDAVQKNTYRSYFENTIRTKKELEQQFSMLCNVVLMVEDVAAAGCFLHFLEEQAETVSLSLSNRAYLQNTREIFESVEHWLPIQEMESSETKTVEFPQNVFPPAIESYANGIATALKVNRAPVYTAMLSACAATLQRKAVTVFCEDETQIIPLNLYVLLVGESGASKSPIFKTVFAPLQQCIAQATPAYQQALSAYKAKRDIHEERLRHRKKQLQSEDCPETEAEILAAQMQMDAILPPHNPNILSDDTTTEALTVKMFQCGETAAIVSDEPSTLHNILGQYTKDGNANNILYLKAFGGDRYAYNRRNAGGEIVLEHPLITMCIGTQYRTFDRLTQSDALLDNGLIQRFLWCHLESYKVDSSRIPFRDTAVKSAYFRMIERFYQMPDADAEEVIFWSEEACQVVHQALDTMWNVQKVHKTFLNKAEITVAKLAALLHMMWQDVGVHAECIDKDTAIRAVQLLEYFYETMFTERDFAGEELQKLEQKLYEKTIAVGRPRISRREILRTVCSNRTEKCELLLDTLLAERKIAVLNGKRKDSFEVLISPFWHL